MIGAALTGDAVAAGETDKLVVVVAARELHQAPGFVDQARGADARDGYDATMPKWRPSAARNTTAGSERARRVDRSRPHQACANGLLAEARAVRVACPFVPLEPVPFACPSSRVLVVTGGQSKRRQAGGSTL